MRLADFIRENHPRIIHEWEEFASSLVPVDRKLTRESLRDHADEILCAIADDIDSHQSEAEQERKSKGRGRPRPVGAAGRLHADHRFYTGFTLVHLVAEYRALRASVLRLWEEREDRSNAEIGGVTRFNEAIDEALAEAMARYTQIMDRCRDQFVGILGHDLRSPLAAVMSGAHFLAHAPDAKQARVACRMLTSAQRMSRMVSDLLDLTRARLSGGIPIRRTAVDLSLLCQEVVSEVQASHGGCAVEVVARGDLHGEWDADRLAQVFSNLVANAIQHGKKGAPVTLCAHGEPSEVVIEVHNQGAPIPDAVLTSLFDPLVREPTSEIDKTNWSGSMGLGLYIAHEVVVTHGGKIDVSSSKNLGTTFSVVLPRASLVRTQATS